MIVVLDANILASMAVARDRGVLAAILGAWRQGQFLVAISDHLISELRRTLANSYFSTRLTSQDAQMYLAFVRSASDVVPITTDVSGVATHPEDDLVIAAAVSARADYLVPGDNRLRNQVPSYQGCRVVCASEFLAVLSYLLNWAG